ncbi:MULTISPECIES: peptidoglycan-binding protein [unclassified Lysobacter]|uniref:peptidoglycan-binding protein n=1 Tax=unclassified Lysobacter TaxID=2635362 RepID=UPI0006F783D1|nr:MULTISPECIES: peptidoglycan-binding protein [unclassified Lysobacter]KRC34872.1 hypothetical protein ASE10_09295 [Lysobacter sp. Root76]KRD70561.1 hypothetical protein ASE45_01465 [Lysobacter sp. Root96]
MEEDKKRKKYVIYLAEDGLPKDDVSHYTATAEHLRSYDKAADELYKFKVPTLLNTKDPHSYLLFGLMDGTQNDVAQDPLNATNVARFKAQAEKLKSAGLNIEVLYEAGPATQTNPIKQKIDAATGYTSESIAEQLYGRIVEQTNSIYEQDPDAKVAVHAEGFSRGGSQVPILARMIHERGIPNLYRPEIVSDEHGNLKKAFPHFHQAPGHTAMSVGIYDPVPTGAMEKLDRRLPPSVVSGFQINAADERRRTFPVDRIIPAGMSEDGRFLSVSVAGAHSDIGGSYLRNGLGTRSYNLMTDYHDALFSESLLRRLPETDDPRMNVIHRSEEANPFKYMPKTRRDLPAGEVIKLMSDDGSPVPSDPIAAAVRHRPEPMTTAAQITEIASCTRDAARCVPTQMTAPLAEDSMAAARNKLMVEVDIEVRAYEPPRPLSPGAKVMAAAGIAGIAASVVDAKASADRASTLFSQDNPLAAQSELTHYAARGTGGWVGGAATGLAVGWETGPGVIGFAAVGAVAGSHVGENVAKWWDNKQIYEQKDGQGVEWEFNGRQWLRQEQGDLSDTGIRAPTRQSFSALPEKERELNFLASNSATMLALGNVVAPRDPFNLPANDEDAKSLGDANWKRDAESGDWRRETVIARTDRGHPLTRTDTAPPERAAELERDAEQVIKANIASGPAPIAARYELAYKAYGCQSFGAPPSAVTAALANADRLTASNEESYRHGQDGQWRSDSGELAQGNTARELNGTREQLQPALVQHAEQLAAAPAWTPPTREDMDRVNLRTAYAAVGVAPNPDRFDAALEAVQRTREAQGIDANLTSLYVERNEKGGYDAQSPIVHLGRDAQGVHVAAVTSSQDIELALVDQRGLKQPIPETAELRIAALSPQQRDAQDQMIREANRQGVSNDQVQQVAVAAAAAPLRSEGPLPVREVEAVRVVVEAEPISALRVTQPEASSPSPQAATVAEAAPPEPKLPGRTMDQPNPAGQAEQSDVLATKPAGPGALAPQPASAPEAPAELPTAPTPQVAPPVAADLAPVPPVAQPVVAAATQPVQAVPAVAGEAASLAVPEASQPPQAAPTVAAEAMPAPDDGALSRGDRGQEVELLQYRLQRVGYRGPADAPAPEPGHFDASTEHAVRQLQRDHGLAETGRVDPDTVQALAVAQQAKIESQKSVAPSPASEAVAQSGQAKPAPMGAEPQKPDVPVLAVGEPERQIPSPARPEPELPIQSAPFRAASVSGHLQPVATQSAERTNPDRDEARREVARLSPADQAMFAKIRGAVPTDVSDEVVAKAMLEAKRNGIPDVERVGQVGVVDGKLWVGSVTPGFHASVPAHGPAPSIQDTLKETQAVNQQCDQQLAMDASQRQQDEQQRPGRAIG